MTVPWVSSFFALQRLHCTLIRDHHQVQLLLRATVQDGGCQPTLPLQPLRGHPAGLIRLAREPGWLADRLARRPAGMLASES